MSHAPQEQQRPGATGTQQILAYYGELAWCAPDPQVAARARVYHRLWERLFGLAG